MRGNAASARGCSQFPEHPHRVQSGPRCPVSSAWSKRDDEIYARFEVLTGLGPSEILFFDDTEENVAAARRRGWQAERVAASHLDPVMQIRQQLCRRGII